MSNITHEEAKRAFGNAMVAELEDECNFNCNIVEEYFKQQQAKEERAKNVEELLGLKNKHISHLQSLYASTISYDSELINQWSFEVRKVQSDIWKLEKELEELK